MIFLKLKSVIIELIVMFINLNNKVVTIYKILFLRYNYLLNSFFRFSLILVIAINIIVDRRSNINSYEF